MRRTKLPAKMDVVLKPYYPTNTWKRHNIAFRNEAGPAIYFLMRGQEVVYIGQTKDLSNRVYHFSREHGPDNFDKVGIYRPGLKDIRKVPWWEEADQDSLQANLDSFLRDLESYFICIYRPRFNKRTVSYSGQRKFVNKQDTSLTCRLNWLDEQVKKTIIRCPI